MSERAYPVWLVLLAALLGLPRGSSADPFVIYSNFGSAPGYVEGDWEPRPFWDPKMYMQSDTSLYAMAFVPTVSGHLSSVTLPVVWAGQFPSGVNMWIMASDDGLPVNTCGIECWRLDVPAGAEPRNASLLTAESVRQPLLTAGTRYFLAMHAAGPGFDRINWPWNNAGIEGVYASFGLNARPTLLNGPLGAFEIHGDNAPVPEPGTVLLVVSGAGALMQRARRRARSPQPRWTRRRPVSA